MTVRQAENGTWLTQFRCRDRFGEEIHKCKRGFATAEEAQAWEDEFVASAGVTMEMTFERFFEIYRHDVAPRLRESTWRGKEYMVNSKVMPYFKDYRMCDIESIDIVRWQNGLMDPAENGGKSFKPTYLRTINN